jgi:hypothetical protein
MSDLNDFIDLKKNVEELRSKVHRAEGSLEQGMKRLENEFGCKSLEEAEDELKELRRKEEKEKKAFQKALAKYEKEYEDAIE